MQSVNEFKKLERLSRFQWKLERNLSFKTCNGVSHSKLERSLSFNDTETVALLAKGTNCFS